MKNSRVRTRASSSSKKMLGTVCAGIAMICGTAALAGGVSLVYSRLEMPDSLVARWLVPPLAVLATSGSTTGGLPTAVGSTTTSVTPPPAPIRKMKIGMNINEAPYYEPIRIFSNLAANEGWLVDPANGAPATGYFDANRNPIKLNPGDSVYRFLQTPTAAYRGKSVDVICRWEGEATLSLLNHPHRQNYSIGTNWLRYTYVPTSDPEWLRLQLLSVNASNPIRNLDCRETSAKPGVLFDPTYLAHVSRFNTIRFLGWQQTNKNSALTWAERTTPAMGQVYGKDGYAVENLVAIANQAQANPWFCMSWNADDDYIRRFAEKVRDTLDPNLTVYVENSNEVWNWVFPVTHQAVQEGLDRGLSTDITLAYLYRYAEKTAHVMDIWRDVFAGQEHRLVRVAASQSANPWLIMQVLAFKDTPAHLDAIASAPYFDGNLTGYSDTPASIASLFAQLKTNLDSQIQNAIEYKKVAQQNNLRFVTYEGGQHVIGEDAALNLKIQNDPRMGQLYTYYMTRWNNEVGDLLVLLSDVSKTSKWGAWGMLENIGQTSLATPKSRAMTLFLASIGK